ncbi:hypothetical protein NDU88_003890 [Pleurodeles waltl]|uniref:Uncharacterized protein n=1 Tax=Pleurodeles waltl TaxID=8319 RepID=A0AAV7LH11_PLEWA|nr:hypothetical protein NDU88_003890 [Pleurodeles waltl]
MCRILWEAKELDIIEAEAALCIFRSLIKGLDPRLQVLHLCLENLEACQQDRAMACAQAMQSPRQLGLVSHWATVSFFLRFLALHCAKELASATTVECTTFL